MDAVCRQHIGRDLRKERTVVATVVCNGYADLLIRISLPEIIGQTLRSDAHGIAVHTVRSRAHYAAQPTSTEFEILIKIIYQFLRILLTQKGFYERLRFGIDHLAAQPRIRFRLHLLY